MNQKRQSRAFSLVEMMAGLLIGGVALYGGLKAFDYFQKQNTKVAAKATAGTQVSTIGNFLKARFEGSKNFQKLAIRFPAVSGSFNSARTSIGPGYAVYPNTGYNGSVLPSQCTGKMDNINVVVAASGAPAIKIDTPPGSGTSLKIGPVTGTDPISGLFKTGDLIVLSTVTASEAIYVPTSLSVPSSGTGALTEILIDGYSGKSLINGAAAGAKFINTYVAGDYVYRALPYQLGVFVPDGNECLGTLKFGARSFLPGIGDRYGSPASQVVAEGVTKFKVSPILETDVSDCPALSSNATPVVDRTKDGAVWDAINADASGKCYSALKAIKITYSIRSFSNAERGVAGRLEGKGIATEEFTGEYVFQSNK